MSDAGAIETLLARSPFAPDDRDRDTLFARAMREAFAHHLATNSAFRALCEDAGLSSDAWPDSVADYPYVPAALFKHPRLTRGAAPTALRLRSSGTGGAASEIAVCPVTARRQAKASAKVIAAYLGATRRPFLVLDTPPVPQGDGPLAARSAATRGFLPFASTVEYLAVPGTDPPAVDLPKLQDALERCARGDEPVGVYGPTYALYRAAIAPLLAAGTPVRLPAGSKVAHLGGWKRLGDERVDRATFVRDAALAFGVTSDDIVDFYGFTEQMGLVYGSTGGGPRVTPCYAELIVRDPDTLLPVPDGATGLVQILTPVPHSYPGISVLTDDVGRVVGRGVDAQGRRGTWFEIDGRAPRAEPRGCGDAPVRTER